MVLVEVTPAQHEAAARTLRAGEDVDVVDVAVAVLRGAGERVELDAVHPLAGDDVDHAADRVGAVHRRASVLQDLDALHRSGGNGVQVDRGARADPSVDHALSVHQHQRALRAEVAQVDLRLTVAAVVHVGVQRAALLGLLLEELTDRGHAARGDLVAADHGDWRRGGEVLAAHARASHDDLFLASPSAHRPRSRRFWNGARGCRNRIRLRSLLGRRPLRDGRS